MKKPFGKILLGSVGLVAAIATPLTVVACSRASIAPGHIYENWFFDDRPVVLDMSKIQSADQLLTLPSINDYYNSRMVIGSYGEQREFYATITTDSIHYGMDVLVPAGTSVYSPYKGELLFASYVNKNAATTTASEGIGGVAVLKVNVADMTNLTEKEKTYLLSLLTNEKSAKKPVVAKSVDYVYIELLHLGPSISLIGGAKTNLYTTGNISFYAAEIGSSLAVKQGQYLGEVGTVEQNGGWAPHIHVQLMNPASEASIIRFTSGKIDSIGTIRTVAVGPSSNTNNGTILDANLFLKVLQTKAGSYIIPHTLTYVTAYSVVDPLVAKNIVATLPFTLGTTAPPVIEDLPPGPDTYAAWSQPVYTKSTATGAKIADANAFAAFMSTAKAGDKFVATYERTSSSATPSSYKLTATYTVVEPSLPDGFAAKYFIVQGTTKPPVPFYVPAVANEGYEPWSKIYYSGGANSVFSISSIPRLTGASTFYASYNSQPQLLNRRVTVYPV